MPPSSASSDRYSPPCRNSYECTGPASHSSKSPVSRTTFSVLSVNSVVKFQFCSFASAIIPAHELRPAPPGNPRWLRAPLLGRQHQRNLRTPLLLRRLFLSRPLSPGKAQLFHRADRHAHRHFGGMVWFLAIFGGALADK